MKDCVFCKIIKGELPSKIEYEDDSLMVFRNINPVAPIHLLIIPKRHIVNLSEVSEEDKSLLGNMLITAQKVAAKLGISDAFRVSAANGEGAGQSVFHMHFHLTGGWVKKYNEGEDET